MPRYFLDSSALAKRYLDEPGTQRVLEIVESRDPVIVSRLTLVEVTSAAVRRANSGHASPELFRDVLAALEDDFRTLFDVIELGGATINRATDLARAHALRAADAIQLASALIATGTIGESSDLVVVCSDRELNAAAEAENLSVLDPANP